MRKHRTFRETKVLTDRLKVLSNNLGMANWILAVFVTPKNCLTRLTTSTFELTDFNKIHTMGRGCRNPHSEPSLLAGCRRRAVLRLYGHQRMHDEVPEVQRSRNCRRNPSSWVRWQVDAQYHTSKSLRRCIRCPLGIGFSLWFAASDLALSYG